MRAGRRSRAMTAMLLASSISMAACGGKQPLGHDAAAAVPDATVERGAETTTDRDGDTTDAPTDASADARADAGTDADARTSGADADAAPLPLCDAGSDAGDWQLLGGPLSASVPPAAWVPAIALDERDQPVVAWLEGETIFTQVWKETGCVGAWQPLGTPVTGSFPSLASDAHGLVRAYMRSPGSTLAVERWNGSAFVALGPPLDAMFVDGAPTAPGLTTDAAGNPVVAWGAARDTVHANVQVARWSGTAWRALTDVMGVPDSYVWSSLYLTPVSIALTADGTPLVAWPGFSDRTGVAKLAGATTWNAVGTPLEDLAFVSESSGPVVRLNGAGTVFVASMTKTAAPTSHPTVFRLDADAWTPLGDPPMTAGDGQDYDLAIDATGAPVLFAVEQRHEEGGHPALFMYRWSGTSWDSMSAPPFTGTEIPREVRLLFDGRGRRLTAWSEPSDRYVGIIRVARTLR
jgi:predicted small lipoprotein YifL